MEEEPKIGGTKAMVEMFVVLQGVFGLEVGALMFFSIDLRAGLEPGEGLGED